MSKRIGRMAFCIPSFIHNSKGKVLEWERAGEGWAGKQGYGAWLERLVACVEKYTQEG